MGIKRYCISFFPFLNKGPIVIYYIKMKILGFLFHYMTSRFSQTSAWEQGEITKDNETEKKREHSRPDPPRAPIAKTERVEETSKDSQR